MKSIDSSYQNKMHLTTTTNCSTKDSHDYNKIAKKIQQFVNTQQSVSQETIWDQICLDNQKNVPFCPYCGKYVHGNDSSLAYKFELTNRLYLAHFNCTKKQSQLQMIQSFQIVWPQPHSQIKKQKRLALSDKQYIMDIQIYHPLSQFIYFRGFKKVIFNGKSLEWDLYNPKATSFQNNIVLIPLEEFIIKINLIQMSKNSKSKHSITLFTNFQASIKQSLIQYLTDCINYKIQFTVISDNNEKQIKIKEMNFKYPYPLIENYKLVQINKVYIVLKNNSSTHQSQQEISQTQTTFVNNNFKLSNPQQGQFQQRITMIDQRQILKEKILTHAGSKQFQKQLQFMTVQEIDKLIMLLYDDIPNLIAHQYANYMFQSLISVCNLNQRIKIINTLKNRLNQLVCSKQGTFCLQQFTKFFTHEEQFRSICQTIQKHFIEISSDNNGTYFIRKLLKSFPMHLLVKLYQQADKNILQLVTDKNGVCVIKIMFQILAKEPLNSCISQYMSKFLNKFTQQFQVIVQDQYGNYIIQECFQLLKSEQLEIFNDFIIQNFAIYATKRYSNNVISKCIKSYWKNKRLYANLNNALKIKDINFISKSREGNKILIELLENRIDFQLKQKIETNINYFPQKYNGQQRYNNKKCNTGKVGTKANNFTQATLLYNKYQ